MRKAFPLLLLDHDVHELAGDHNGLHDGREGFVVSEDAPHFFGYVRGKRVQQLDERFAGFAIALVHLHHFVVEDHQLANRGVKAHVLDVARHLDDGQVHHLLDCFGGGLVNVNRSGIVVTDNGTPVAGKVTIPNTISKKCHSQTFRLTQTFAFGNSFRR